MTLRRIIAVLVFCAAVFFGLHGLALFLAKVDGYAIYVALIYSAWGIFGTLLAVFLWFGKPRERESYEVVYSSHKTFGDYVGLIGAALLGLACLYAAAKGLWNGEIGNPFVRRNPVVKFSTRPINYLVLVSIVGGIGAGLVWVSWRMLFERPKDET
jgi:hypothetical protein